MSFFSEMNLFHASVLFLYPLKTSENFSVFEKINPFHAIGLFLYPPKTSENLYFSDVFGDGGGGGYR